MLSDFDQAGPVKFVDLFCGIGGFRFAVEKVAKARGITASCVFSSDIDGACQDAYEANFGERPSGDIKNVESHLVPDHDLLLAGFPCQPFSIIGQKRGFDDTRGTLFFDIARILEVKRPKAFVLENVKMLVGHDGGRTIRRIMETLRGLGYHAEFKVLNALDFGLPQKRERVWIVGSRTESSIQWPSGGISMKPLSEVLEKDVPQKYYASEHIREKRRNRLKSFTTPSIWHENKAGNISAYPYSCALRAGASYNYLLVDGKRRLTPREMLRLQGFPDTFKIVSSDSQTRKQAGNSLPVNVAEVVLESLFEQQEWGEEIHKGVFRGPVQLTVLEGKGNYHGKRAEAQNRREA